MAVTSPDEEGSFFELWAPKRQRGAVPATVHRKKDRKNCGSLMSTADDHGLAKEPYYHRLLPREDIVGLVPNPGDFILRRSEPTAGQPRQIVLSVCLDLPDPQHTGTHLVKHFIIKVAGGKYTIDRFPFDTVQELCRHHVLTQETITSAKDIQNGVVVIKNAIGRQHWELLHKDIASTKKLGEGAFGEVHLGTWTKRTGEVVKVAIKMAKVDAMTKEQIKEIMREARIMRSFDHPHVVSLYGVAAAEEPLQLVMELASHGGLDDYLKKNAVGDNIKAEMCTQAAWGLEYLHAKNIIHRDVAARNCLYGDGKVKISDFGMSRDGPTYQMDPKRRVPIRWLSPETMRVQVYNFKTDEPYINMTPGEAHKFVLGGGRMEWVVAVREDVKALIRDKTWAGNPAERLSMEGIAVALQGLLVITRPSFRSTRPASQEAPSLIVFPPYPKKTPLHNKSASLDATAETDRQKKTERRTKANKGRNRTYS